MAIEKSTLATNAVAEPRVASKNRGVLKSAADTAEIANGANGDSMILKCKVPVTSVIRSVRVASDDLVGLATLSVGFHKQDNAPLGTSYTAVDVDAIANEIDVNGAAVAFTEVRFSIQGIETVNKAAWELAGLSARPEYGELFVSLTAETGTEAAGTVSMIVDFID